MSSVGKSSQQFLEEPFGIDFEGLQDPDRTDNIKAAPPLLDAIHVVAAMAETFRQLVLRDACALSRLAKQGN